MKKNGAGLLLCLIIAVPAWFLGQAVPVIGGPVFAILIGMILTLILTKKDAFTPGINYTSKKILQAAVVFLGFGMNLTEILAKGKQSLPIIISTISTSLIIAFILYKALKLRTNNAILVGVGSSICGGSAIAATAPVIKASDEEVAQSISVIFLFNVLAALITGSHAGLKQRGIRPVRGNCHQRYILSNRGRNSVGRNTRKQYSGIRRNRKNDKNPCDHTDHTDPCHLQRKKRKKYRRLHVQPETVLPLLRAVLRTGFCCHHCVPAACRCHSSAERTEQVPHRHGNGRHRTEHKYRKINKDRRKADLYRILLLGGDHAGEPWNAACAGGVVNTPLFYEWDFL